MIAPAYLENLVMPPERISEVSGFRRFYREGRFEDLVRNLAWHEAGHAVSWVLNGGTLVKTTIIVEGDENGVVWGGTSYNVSDEPSKEERLRLIFSAMGSHAICDLGGTPTLGEFEDFQSAVDHLRVLHSDSGQVYEQFVQTWIEVLKFFSAPRVWRTADAFARRLISERTVNGFPDDCISNDNSPVAGLQEALARELRDLAREDDDDWIGLYVFE